MASNDVVHEEFSTETVEMTGTTDFLSQPAALTEEVQLVMDSVALGDRTIQSTETVTVETTQTVDPAEVSLDNFVVMDNPIPGNYIPICSAKFLVSYKESYVIEKLFVIQRNNLTCMLNIKVRKKENSIILSYSIPNFSILMQNV